MFKPTSKILLMASLILAFVSVSKAYAFGVDYQSSEQTQYEHQADFDPVVSQFAKPVALPQVHSQNRQEQVRSRSEVMQEVKERYNAKVLKISLNSRGDTYNVRILMPNGKVRNLQVNARRR